MRLSRNFFERNTVEVAKDLPGSILIKKDKTGIKKKYLIVEVEAYRENDAASHSCAGRTDRNFVMFGRGGHIYIYLCYGMYYMLNFSTEKESIPGAVLIRGIEPLDKDDLIKITCKNLLTNGPGKLTKYLNITRKDNNKDLCARQTDFYVLKKSMKPEVVSAPRIGIKEATDKLWRFYIKGNKFVSKI